MENFIINFDKFGGNKINYIRTLDIDEPLSKVDDNGLVYHYIRDGLGSIIGIVDDLGNKISLIHYDPFGNSLSTESFGFNGRENDSTAADYITGQTIVVDGGLTV